MSQQPSEASRIRDIVDFIKHNIGLDVPRARVLLRKGSKKVTFRAGKELKEAV